MNRPAGTEKPRSWKATNDTTYPLGRGTDSSLGTFHSKGVVGGGSCPASIRRRSCSRETLERVQFDICSSGVLDGLEAQGTAALRMRKNSERGGQAREEEEDGKAKSRTSTQHAVLKGADQPLTFDTRPAVLAGLSPTRARASAKQPPTRATPRFP
jgi:hypothetical protein